MGLIKPLFLNKWYLRGTTCRRAKADPAIRCFDPRPRVGGDVWLTVTALRSISVSIHAPVWGATAERYAPYLCVRVSIHAPVWGATCCGVLASKWAAVSIHAPVWGATSGKRGSEQSRAVSIHAPVWGATIHDPSHRFVCCVSIHAPVWGATPGEGIFFAPLAFRSTPPCGGRRHSFE